MNINAELVLHIARLARLELTDPEVDLFARQLQDILHYIEKLDEVKQTDEPFVWSSFLPGAARPDELQPSLPVDEALKNAPQRARQFFRVPRILP